MKTIRRVANSTKPYPDVAVDWFLALRALGIDFANQVEDLRLAQSQRERRQVPFLEALSSYLLEECDLAGSTYEFEDRFYFMPWAPEVTS